MEMLNLKQIAAVFAGGGLGSLLRFLISVFVRNNFPVHFPVATFIVNITACFILGFVSGYAGQKYSYALELRLFLTVGFCGGFSTFSAFSLESVQLLQTNQYLSFSIYIFFSVMFCIAATVGGIFAASYFGNQIH